jgi:hypothetical protein
MKNHRRERQSTTEADLLRCIEAVDKLREVHRSDHGKFTIASNEAPGKSAEKTAKIVGTSRTKEEKARTVLSDPEEKEAVMSGKKSINRASQDTKAKKKRSR